MAVSSLALVCAVTLGITLLVSGLSKLRDHGAFVLGVLEYQVLPARVASVYGRILPVLEVITGVLLIAGMWPKIVGLLAMSLLMSFLVAVSLNLFRGRHIDCHCFGSQSKEPLSAMTVMRLCILLVGAFVVVAWQDQRIFTLDVPDLLSVLLTAVGLNVVLYLLSVLPMLWRVWQMKRVVGVTPGGGRVSLRRQPVGKSIFDLPASAWVTVEEGNEQ